MAQTLTKTAAKPEKQPRHLMFSQTLIMQRRTKKGKKALRLDQTQDMKPLM
jgi:hypothetical protein